MKYVYLLLAVIFALFAYWQFNDPDPWLWVPTYGWVAVLCGMAAAGRFHKVLLIATAVVLGGWMLTMVPGFVDWISMGAPTITGSMKAESPYVELVREFLGLMIAVVAVVFLLVQRARTEA